MLMDNNEIITTMTQLGGHLMQQLYLCQSPLAVFLDKRSLVCYFTFHALWFLKHCFPLSLDLIRFLHLYSKIQSWKFKQ